MPVAAGPSAVALNVAVLNDDSYSFLGVYPSSASPPVTSDINFGPGDILANYAATQAAGASFAIYNSVGSVDSFVDLEGTYS